jgi:hypothetical protein
MKPCPLCRSSAVYASHRTGILEQGPLTWLGILPFRCGDCQSRFYRLAWFDPRRRRRYDSDFASDEPRPPRWPLRVRASVTVERPGEGPVSLSGMTENASLGGARLHLPEAVPQGSRVEVSFEGGVVASGSVRWNRPEGEQDVVHGLRLDSPLKPPGQHSKPLRRLRRRRFLRRLLIGLLGLALIAAATWGLVWMMDAFRAYNPQYYEPKDIDRQRYELQRQLEEMSRQAK